MFMGSLLVGNWRSPRRAALVAIAAAVLGPSLPARSLERKLSLSFTREILYTLASDGGGERNREMAQAIIGLSPAITAVSIERTTDRLILSFATAAEEVGKISFSLAFDKMDAYKLAVAREDVRGIKPIMDKLKSRSRYLKFVDYRFDSRYAIIEITLDLDRFLEEMKSREAGKPPPAPGPVEATPPGKSAIPKPKEPTMARAAAATPGEAASLMVGRAPNPPVIDGRLNDVAWSDVPPLKIDVGGAGGALVVEARALHDGENIFIAFSWPDRSRDDKHRPWIWSTDRGEYLSSPAMEDGIALQFSDEDIPSCMTSGRDYQADLWFWRAARTNPSGYADDGRLVVSTKKLSQANSYKSSSGGNVWIKSYRDEGTPPYRSEIAVGRGKDEVPRYLPQKPAGSMADVSAKGRWETGRWSVEMARKLDTGHGDDLVFTTGKNVYRFAVSVFNSAEGRDHSASETVIMNLE